MDGSFIYMHQLQLRLSPKMNGEACVLARMLDVVWMQPYSYMMQFIKKLTINATKLGTT